MGLITALIFAGGTGKRMGSDGIPKQFINIEGKSIIMRTLEHFSRHPQVDSIVIVCLESWIEELKRQIRDMSILKVKEVLPGGATGYQSIHKGLLYIVDFAQESDLVLLCDGVRPVLSSRLISQCIEEAERYGTAVPVTPSIDSVLYSKNGQDCVKNFDRASIFITQAPQGYRLGVIMAAHREAEARNIETTSSADLLLNLGQRVHLFPGMRDNIKVTTPEDLEQLQAIYSYQHKNIKGAAHNGTNAEN